MPKQTSQPSSRGQQADSQQNKIFVGGLSPNTTEQQIHDYFSKFGKIDSKELFIARGFCYVTYVKAASADACVSAQVGSGATQGQTQHQIAGKWVEVKKSYPPRESGGGKTKGSKGKSDYDWAEDTSSRKGKGSSDESTSKSKGGGKESRSGTVSSKSAAGITTSSQAIPTLSTQASVTPGAVLTGTSGRKPETIVAAATNNRNSVTDSRCKELCDMGFSLRQVKRVLASCGWDVNMALDKLLIEGVEADPRDVLPSSTLVNSKGKATEAISTASGSIDDDSKTNTPKEREHSKTTTPKDGGGESQVDSDTGAGKKGNKGKGKWGAKGTETNNAANKVNTTSTTVTTANRSLNNSADLESQQNVSAQNVNVQETAKPAAKEGTPGWGQVNPAQEEPKWEEKSSWNQESANAKAGWGTAPWNAKTSDTQKTGWGKPESEWSQTPKEAQEITPHSRQDSAKNGQATPQAQWNENKYPNEQQPAQVENTTAQQQQSQWGNAAQQPQQTQQQQQKPQQSSQVTPQNAQGKTDETGLSGWDTLMTSVAATTSGPVSAATTSNTSAATPQLAQQQQNMMGQQQQNLAQQQPQQLGQQQMGYGGQQNGMNNIDYNNGQQQYGQYNNGYQYNQGQQGGQQQQQNFGGYGQQQQQQNQSQYTNNSQYGYNGQQQQAYNQQQPQQQGQQVQQVQQNQVQQPNQQGQQAVQNQQGQQAVQNQQGQQGGASQPQQNGETAQQGDSSSASTSEERVIIQPCQSYSPDQQFNSSNQQFLKIDASLQQNIEVMLYNSNNSGWSFGRCVATDSQGWFPTSCAAFDVVATNYVFDTRPEQTRSYISFQSGQRVVVQRRHECGWWIGSVIENMQHGTLGPKGYFPGNYCSEIEQNN